MNTKILLAQCQNNRYHDINVRRTPAFAPEQLVYIEKPSFGTFSFKDADKVANRTYNKLMPNKMGHFKIIKANDHTLLVNEIGTYITVSIQ